MKHTIENIHPRKRRKLEKLTQQRHHRGCTQVHLRHPYAGKLPEAQACADVFSAFTLRASWHVTMGRLFCLIFVLVMLSVAHGEPAPVGATTFVSIATPRGVQQAFILMKPD